MKMNDLRDRIFNIRDNAQFKNVALEIFESQLVNNKIYRSFVNHLGRASGKISDLEELPFLPVEFFRDYTVLSGRFPVDIIFESSGTTGMMPARHFVKDLSLYEESFMECFRLFYGNPEEYVIAAILPSYTERRGSSLVYMADSLIKSSGHSVSGFYKDNKTGFISHIQELKESSRKILVLGVSFALLDLAEQHSPDLSGVIVMETGGMKGRRKEVTREELHSVLSEKLKVPRIHSEYGMTELLSQAYSKGDGIFHCPPWMKIILRDPQDPLTLFTEPGRTGGINVIDLANVNSCSFIATGDLGKLHDDGGFEVLGRFDSSDVRGCNLMAE